MQGAGGVQEERRLPGGGVVWLQSMSSKTGGKEKIKHLSWRDV